MNRRRFAFCVGFGIFSVAEPLEIYGLDELAGATLRGTSPDAQPTHWRAAENATWRWFERETFISGQWKLSGITTPINKFTGKSLSGESGYLGEALAPIDVREGKTRQVIEASPELVSRLGHRRPDDNRKARHGRPPSEWLRNLRADELRIWLRTIDVPPADVSGMTFWTHLTRDHYFLPANIGGLSEDDQAKLHAAAHAGY